VARSAGIRFGFLTRGGPFWFSHEHDVIDRLNEIIVVPATRTIRGLTTEVVLTADDGMPAACALNFDHVSLAQRNRIGPVLCSLSEARWVEVWHALLIPCGFGGGEDG
jgi:mRNA interferase MazF